MTRRTLTVAPERLERWLSGFVERHGPVACAPAPHRVSLGAADGAVADCQVPFPPLVADPTAPYGGLVAHACRVRAVGVVLVRRGGYAVGVFDGARLVASKVGSRHVQGRTAAGGWSQQRFARRREKQVREAFTAASDAAARVVLPRAASLDAVVLGGDRQAADAVLADRRLGPLRERVVPPLLAVPDPRLAVLRRTPELFRAVRIDLTEPSGPGLR